MFCVALYYSESHKIEFSWGRTQKHMLTKPIRDARIHICSPGFSRHLTPNHYKEAPPPLFYNQLLDPSPYIKEQASKLLKEALQGHNQP